MVTRIRLANEYGVRFPVWSDVGDTLEDELPLSSQLRERIRVWAHRFNQLYDWDVGWADGGACWAEHVSDARRLADDLRRELGDQYEVELHLWEFNGLTGAARAPE